MLNPDSPPVWHLKEAWLTMACDYCNRSFHDEGRMTTHEFNKVWQQDKGDLGFSLRGCLDLFAILMQHFQLLKDKLSCGGLLFLHSGSPTRDDKCREGFSPSAWKGFLLGLLKLCVCLTDSFCQILQTCNANYMF